jgi:hypothetical protein
MAGSHSDTENSRSLSATTGGRADTSRDEIDLIDYFTVLWRRRYFIVLGTVLPSLLVFCVSYYTPGDCRISYTYDIRNIERGAAGLLSGSMNAKAPPQPDGNPEADKPPGIVQTTVPDRFYSDENLDKLAAKLKESGFGDYAQRISKATVQLEISETLLALTVTGRQGEDVRGISSIVRDNLEKVIPMYFVKDHLIGDAARLKAAMADIEENNSRLELELKRKKAVLARLKTLVPAEPGGPSGSVILHFDAVHQNIEYLPPFWQMQAVDANIIYIEEAINADQEKFNYYGKLQSLDEMLLAEVRNKMSSYYTVEDFLSFLTRMAADWQDSELGHYLSAYAKRIENVVSAVAPIVERPRISAVPKGGLKKASLVFVALLMVTTFGAFLLDVTRKSRKPGAVRSS